MAAKDKLGKMKGDITRAGMSFAGTGSGLGGTGARAAQRGIGGDGPSLEESEGDFMSVADLSEALERNGRASNRYASLSLSRNNPDKKYQLMDKRSSDGIADDTDFRTYDNPYAAQNEFDFRLAKAKQGYAKGGSVSMRECKTNTSSKNKASPNW